MTVNPRFVVVGAGMAGLLSATKLREAGFTDITVYEKADRLGGTWRENTYPGIACDVPSHLYTYSFAPNPDWSHAFSPGAEILGYLEAVANRHGVAGLVRYGTEVRRLEYDGSRWRIELSTGQRDEADVVIAATGVLHHPRYPDIDGLDEFAGPLFHSARWDHDAPLSGARLGVIGTGSSAVQITGALVDVVGELHLFQRTPQWVLAVDNPPISDDDRARYRADPTALVGLRDALNANFVQGFANAVVDAESPALTRLQELGRANLEEHVADPDLREKLRPHYRAGCKRLIISPNFYDAIQRPNARLVTERIDRVEAGGVRTVDGLLHELDVLALATGFRVDRFLRPIEVVGRDGVRLDDLWTPRPYAYSVGLGARLPEPVHAQRPQRPGRQLLADRRRRGAVRVSDPAHRSSAPGRVPIGLRQHRSNGSLRGAADGGGEEHGLGDRLPQLVPRRPRHTRRLAVELQSLSGGDGASGARRLRARLA